MTAMRMDKPGEHTFKIILIGDSGTGKTNLLTRFACNEFKMGSTTTMGVDITTKCIKFNGKSIRARLFDTAGQERFRTIVSAFYRDADAALLIYDITDYRSYKNTEFWLQELRTMCKQDAIVMLVGNKCDLHAFRSVPIEDATAFALLNQMSFIETSALDSTNVKHAFISILSELCAKSEHTDHYKDEIVLSDAKIMYKKNCDC